MIYLDHAASSPCPPAVIDAVAAAMHDAFGNAGSLHRTGRTARRLVDEARAHIAALARTGIDNIVLTSGATESNHIALFGSAPAASTPPIIIISAVEHPSIARAAAEAARRGVIRLTVLPVDPFGRVQPSDLEAVLQPETTLVSIQSANHETGVLQPVHELAALCSKRGVPFHTDAVQSFARLPSNQTAPPGIAVTVSAHKIGGPKGVGALVWPTHHPLRPLHAGGPQERTRRPGTENVPAIAGFGVAARMAAAQIDATHERLKDLRDRLEEGILSSIAGTWRNGSPHRAPHIANIGFEGLEAETLMFELDAADIAVSTGAACSSGSLDPSPVLLAMGQDHPTALSALRFSVGPENTGTEIDQVLDSLKRIVRKLRTQRSRDR